MEEKYCVIRVSEYYGGNVQHPSGIEIAVEIDASEYAESPMVGSLDECREWEDRLHDSPVYLGHGEAGRYWIICKIDDDDADIQSWLDSQDWDGCPSEDGSDYDANYIWAEARAVKNEIGMIVQYPDCSRLMIVSKYATELYADTVNGKFNMTWEDVLDQVRENPIFTDPSAVAIVCTDGTEYTGAELLAAAGVENEAE